KAADSSCNPYIALGGLLAAGLDGIERGLEPPQPVEVDPATLSDSDRSDRGITRLPASLDEACDNLQADSTLMQALRDPSLSGPGQDLLARSYLAVRRSEAKSYAEMSDEEQFNSHFYKY